MLLATYNILYFRILSTTSSLDVHISLPCLCVHCIQVRSHDQHSLKCSFAAYTSITRGPKWGLIFTYQSCSNALIVQQIASRVGRVTTLTTYSPFLKRRVSYTYTFSWYISIDHENILVISFYLKWLMPICFLVQW